MKIGVVERGIASNYLHMSDGRSKIPAISPSYCFKLQAQLIDERLSSRRGKDVMTRYCNASLGGVGGSILKKVEKRMNKRRGTETSAR